MQPPVKADKPISAPSRQAVADSRTQKPDSTPVLAKTGSSLDTARANAVLEERRVAAAPAAPVPVAAPIIAGGVAAGGSAVAANAARSVDKVAADSARALGRRADSTSVLSTAKAREDFVAQAQATRRLRDAPTGFASQGNEAFVGCYQLGDSAAKDKLLPSRFSLELVRADPGANLVRAVPIDGSADTVIARATWERLGTNLVIVRIPSADNMLTVTLQFPAGIATIRGNGTTRTASVTRLTCRR